MYVIVLRRILLRVRDIDIWTDPLDVEGRKSWRELIVIEALLRDRHAIEIGVVNLDPAAVKICDKEIFLSVDFGDCRPLVYRVFRGFINDDCKGAGIPGGDRAVLGYEDEASRLAVYKKISRASIEDDSSWISRPCA
jgi:hypothetical protein